MDTGSRLPNNAGSRSCSRERYKDISRAKTLRTALVILHRSLRLRLGKTWRIRSIGGTFCSQLQQAAANSGKPARFKFDLGCVDQRALRLEISLQKPHCIGDRLRSNRRIKYHRISRRFDQTCGEGV
jgi:hypothetical protein